MAHPYNLTTHLTSLKKNARRLFPVFLLLGSLSACPSNNESTENTSTTTETTTETTLKTPSPSTEATKAPNTALASKTPVSKTVHKGIYVYGEGFQTFKACNGDEEIWVIDTPEKGLEKGFAVQGFMELEPVYVEVEGDIGPAPKDDRDSFAADYDKAITVKSVRLLEPWLMKTHCFDTDFVATGTTPPWQLKSTRSGDVFFKTNEGEFPIVETLAYSAPTEAGNTFKYSFGFRTPDEDKLSVTLTTESCQHEGATYSHKAEVRFRGSTYTGCANRS